MNIRRSIGILLLSCILSFAGCSVLRDGFRVQNDGRDIISIGPDGLKLDGNLTGITLGKDGLLITYPAGDITFAGDGLHIKKGDSTIEIQGDRIEIVDSEGKNHVLDAVGEGAEFRSEDGVVVGTGAKAVMPAGYPVDLVPVMEGFSLTSAAELGDVIIVSGYVTSKTMDDVEAFYQALLLEGNSFKQERRTGMVLLRADLDNRDITVYIYNSLKKDAVNYSVVVGE